VRLEPLQFGGRRVEWHDQRPRHHRGLAANSCLQRLLDLLPLTGLEPFGEPLDLIDVQPTNDRHPDVHATVAAAAIDTLRLRHHPRQQRGHELFHLVGAIVRPRDGNRHAHDIPSGRMRSGTEQTCEAISALPTAGRPGAVLMIRGSVVPM
jgi:hypothetical protein